jgi:hypothetical protein
MHVLPGLSTFKFVNMVKMTTVVYNGLVCYHMRPNQAH